MRSRGILSLLVLVLTLGIAPAVAAQETDPSVSVSPDIALEDGDRVDVTGSGFTPDSEVFVMLCNGDERLGDSIGRCSLVGSGSTGYVIDASGGFVATDVVVPVGQVGASELATCPPSAAQAARGVNCEIQVVTADFAAVAGVSVTYEDQAPAAPTELAFTGLRGTVHIKIAVMMVIVGAFLLGTSVLLRREPERVTPV